MTSTIPEKTLAIPFSMIFKDWTQVHWAFDLFLKAAEILNVHAPDDALISMVYVRDGNHRLRFVFGQWLILGVNGNDGAIQSVHITLFKDQLKLNWKSVEDFSQSENEPQVSLYQISFADFEANETDILKCFFETMKFTAERFRHWKSGSSHHYNNPRLAGAIFDPALREQLLIQGIQVDAAPAGFDAETFQLLELLHNNPTMTVYDEHRDGFKNKIERPFQALMHGVKKYLRPEVLKWMETEKGLFSRFMKNDYGRGGTWDYYWGAFYLKKEKRRASPLLFIKIDLDRLRFGFLFGESVSPFPARFEKNCREHREILSSWHEDFALDKSIILGHHENVTILPDETIAADNPITWADWLSDPGANNYELAYVLPKEVFLKKAFDELAQCIADCFNRFFPMVLLAALENPMEAVAEYLDIDVDETPKHNPIYSLEQCSEETGIEVGELSRWVRAVDRKKQIVLYGPPGTGKTFIAEKLARHLTGGGDGFSQLMQFHPEVSYEDFIQGIRPQTLENGGLHYPVVPGRFIKFCQEAGSRNGTCVLIIDEINRANLARVFGELMYLLEYRDNEVELAAGNRFRIPANVRIIGTMNTADRSIALVDHALRRRFAFLPLYPNYAVLKKYHERENTGFAVEGLIAVLDELNKQIADRHYSIGVSYFLRKDIRSQIADIWQMEIEPYLEEYFFDQPDKFQRFCWEKISTKIMG